MVNTLVRCPVTTSHIRPLDPARDLVAVAGLLEEAFHGELDPAGRRAIREMRLLGSWGGILAWLDSLFFPETGIGPGYVWLANGQVVGHLSLRRSEQQPGVWLIGNVAVRADHRRQGIGRALMEQALEHIRQRGGKQARLIVRANNPAAMRLYSELGFRQTGALAYWQRPQAHRRAPLAPPTLPAGVTVRQARAGDQSKIYDLARSSLPQDMVWVEPIRYADFYTGWDRRLTNWLEGKRHICLVAESDQQAMVGAAWASAPRPPDEGHVRIWVRPGYQSQLEAGLVSAVLEQLAAPVAALVCAFPAQDISMPVALAQFGFAPLRVLAHMQLKL